MPQGLRSVTWSAFSRILHVKSRLGGPTILFGINAIGDHFRFKSLNVLALRKPKCKTHRTMGVMVSFVRDFLSVFITWFGINNNQIRTYLIDQFQTVTNSYLFTATTFTSTPLYLRSWKSSRMEACAQGIILDAYRI